MPTVKLNLKYKPMENITQAPHYYKFVPTVYSDALNFDYADKDYEIREKDKKFLQTLNEKLAKEGGEAGAQSNQVQSVSEHDFERCIDAFEKIYQRTKKKQDQAMLEHFYDLADPGLAKLPKTILKAHLLPYWKEGKRFTRKFWENPDANDPDVTAAFRKRLDAQPKMTLR